MATNLDQIMVYMTKIGSKTGVRLADNQGSTTKGKNTSSGGATTRASQGGRPRSLQMRFRVYLLTVNVAENEKDGSEKHRKNIREEGISFA